jgi:endoglucanase
MILGSTLLFRGLAVVGLLTALALPLRAQTAVSLVANSSLETDANGDGWPDGWPTLNAGGLWLNEDGNHFIRLTSAVPGSTVMLYHEIALPEGTAAIEITWRQRVTRLKPGKQPWFDARIMMGFMDADRAVISPDPIAPFARSDTQGWQDRSVKFLVPPQARILKFMPALFQVETGTYDLDDIVIKPADPAPIKAATEEAAAARAKQQAVNATAVQAKAAATLATGGVLIPNGDFETDENADNAPDGWGSLNGNTSWEVEGNNHFIRLKATEPDKMLMLYRTLVIPAGAKALKLTWRWRVTDLKAGKLPWNDARIMMDIIDASGQKLKPQPNAPFTHNTKDGAWVERTTSFLIPEGGVTLAVMPSLFNVTRGVLDLDDFVVVPTDTAELEAKAKLNAEEASLRYVPPETANKAKWPAELRVQGNRLVTPAGKEFWLQGLNAGGLESVPSTTQPVKSTQVGIDDWKANVVRVPVADKFWFGRNPLQTDGGKAYRDYVDQCVMLAANRGAYIVLDLHQFRAPKPEHAEFWKDAATRYKNHPAVLFDVFNEPFGTSWEVWRNGGFVGVKEGMDESAFLTDEEKKKNQGFDSIGMQALVEAVRSTGAKNIIVAAGLGWSFDLTGITEGYALEDKTGNGIMYSWHVYNWHVGWEKHVLSAAAKYPILVGEVGADTNKMDFIPHDIQESPYTWVPDMLGFIQKHRLNWTGWCFHPSATPVMISDWKYTPTPFWGQFAKDALAGKQFEMKRMR